MAETEIQLRTSDFEYDLPRELIAQVPAERRGADRMLLVRRRGGSAEHQDLAFGDFPSLIEPGDLLVVNTTRVRHARLVGHRASGAKAEVLLIHPGSDGTWIALGKPGAALRPGRRIALGGGAGIETLELLEGGYRRVRVVGATAEEAMARFGRLPLPPYIEREPTPEDEDRYQTVYAAREGSVAAPTAGLHFTPEILAGIEARGGMIAGLELEIGPGTFKPVDEEDYARHPMPAERFEIPEAAAAAVAMARDRASSVWAIGTTVVRALESAATREGGVRAGPGETRLLITPGYEFRVVNRLLTNFHLPRSTLLLLVAAFAGHPAAMEAYRYAVRARYRFYSYGDAMAVIGVRGQ